MLSSLAPLLLAYLLGPPGAAMQDVATPVRSDVEARITALEGVQSEDAQQELGAYREALEALNRAADARQRAEAFARDVSEAPARLETLRTELAQPPEPPALEADTELSLRGREQRLTQAEAELSAARGMVEELARLRDTRLARSAAIPEELARAEQELASRLELLPGLAAGVETSARRARLAAEIDALRAQVELLNAEQAAYEALREVLPLRRDKALRNQARAEQAVRHWRDQVTQRRLAEAEADAREAQRLREETMRRSPELESLAARNEELAALRSGPEGLPQRIGNTQREVVETRQLQAEVERRFRSMGRRIAAGGLTEGMGLVLRRDYEWLLRPAQLEDDAERRAERLSAVHLLQLTVEEERSEFGSVEDRRQRVFDDLGLEEPPEQLVDLATELLETQRELQVDVIEDASELVGVLYDLEVAHGALTESVEQYRSYIERHILWVRSVGANPIPSLLAIPRDAYELATATDWAAAGVAAREALGARAGRCTLLALFLTSLVAGRPLLRRKRAEMADLVRSYRSDKILWTFRAMIHSLLLALPLPLALWTVGWALGQASHPMTRAIGSGLARIAPVYLTLEFLRQIAKERGVGEGHFRWSSRSMRQLRAELRWFTTPAVLLGFVAHALDHEKGVPGTDSIGRAAFVSGMIVLAVFLLRLFRVDSPILADSFQRGTTLLGRTRRVWVTVTVGLPLALAALALSGYYYTAFQFEARLSYSLGFALGLVLVNALLLRWLFVTRRRLAIEQARQRAKAKAAAEESEPDAARESGAAPIDEDAVDIPSVDAQTRQLFRSGLTVAAVVGVYLIWASATPALRGLDRVQFLPHFALLDPEPIQAERNVPAESPGGADGGSGAEPGGAAPFAGRAGSVGGAVPGVSQIAEASGSLSSSLGLPAVLTLADVLLALIFGLLAMIAARNLPGLLEISLLQRLPLDSGSRYAATTIVRYLIVIVGVSAVSGALGLGWEKIQWLAAALTFGLAFGLQEIFANFASGLIILIERPIRVGDIVTVNEIEGRVMRLRMRATTILDWDRRELLIPNKEFITSSVINWTLTDPITRIVIPVGIAYGSDTKKARSLLLKVARESSLVLEDPAPSAIFVNFGESSLEFRLRVFIGNRDLWPEVMDRLHSEIDFAFRQAGIEIAFPQRDLHLRSLPPRSALEEAGLRGRERTAAPDGGEGDGAE